ncbi:MAG: helix-hairpin-helix domain-containing protein [Desulfobulbus sp.]|nr:MAG: helix-hairpin-helix domain-containing protein [Desulfobulbus sp.]
MDLDLREETGKDKRLLVLLAFGILLLLTRLPALFPDSEPPSQSWGWQEDVSQGGGLRRLVIDGNDQPNPPRPATPAETSLSPRLSFLLGRPLAVNRATAEELALLEGIGPKLAAKIIAHRELTGRIDTLSELQEIPGIGRQLTKRLAPLLSFD